MTRGGPTWDNEFCAKCNKELSSWTKAKKKVELVFKKRRNILEVKAVLRKETGFRNKALESGLIRPFLYLVSMEPAMRNSVAASLGWTLTTQEYFGRPHEEAWGILNADMFGIQARANAAHETLNPIARNCNWYEILFRVQREVFKKTKFKKMSFSKSLKSCRNSKDDLLSNLENDYLEKLALLRLKTMTDMEVASLDEFMENKEVKELVLQMKKKGIASKNVLRYGVNSVYQAIRLGGFNTYILTVKVAAALNRQLGTRIAMSQATKAVAKFAAVLNVIGWVWLGVDVLWIIFGSSHPRLFPAVSQILNQRLFLAAEGIRIEDYY